MVPALQSVVAFSVLGGIQATPPCGTQRHSDQRLGDVRTGMGPGTQSTGAFFAVGGFQTASAHGDSLPQQTGQTVPWSTQRQQWLDWLDDDRPIDAEGHEDPAFDPFDMPLDPAPVLTELARPVHRSLPLADIRTQGHSDQRPVQGFSHLADMRAQGHGDPQLSIMATQPELEVMNDQFLFGAAAVHTSHTLGYKRGILWCWRCAGYTTGAAVGKLHTACRQPAALERGPAHVLRRLRAGLTPRAAVQWPFPDEHETPQCLRMFVGPVSSVRPAASDKLAVSRAARPARARAVACALVPASSVRLPR